MPNFVRCAAWWMSPGCGSGLPSGARPAGGAGGPGPALALLPPPPGQPGLPESLNLASPSARHLVALDELDRIKSLGLIEKGEIKQFHILISDAVRRYLEDRYGVDALEMTTWELMIGAREAAGYRFGELARS